MLEIAHALREKINVFFFVCVSPSSTFCVGQRSGWVSFPVLFSVFMFNSFLMYCLFLFRFPLHSLFLIPLVVLLLLHFSAVHCPFTVEPIVRFSSYVHNKSIVFRRYQTFPEKFSSFFYELKFRVSASHPPCFHFKHSMSIRKLISSSFLLPASNIGTIYQ